MNSTDSPCTCPSRLHRLSLLALGRARQPARVLEHDVALRGREPLPVVHVRDRDARVAALAMLREEKVVGHEQLRYPRDGEPVGGAEASPSRRDRLRRAAVLRVERHRAGGGATGGRRRRTTPTRSRRRRRRRRRRRSFPSTSSRARVVASRTRARPAASTSSSSDPGFSSVSSGASSACMTRGFGGAPRCPPAAARREIWTLEPERAHAADWTG